MLRTYACSGLFQTLVLGCVVARNDTEDSTLDGRQELAIAARGHELTTTVELDPFVLDVGDDNGKYSEA